MADRHAKISAQSTIEAAAVLITVAVLVLASVRIWSWFVSRQMVARAQSYERTRVAAGNPNSAGILNPYQPKPLNIFGAQENTDVITDSNMIPPAENICLRENGFYGLQDEIDAKTQEIKRLSNEMQPYVQQVNDLMDPYGDCLLEKSDCHCYGRKRCRKWWYRQLKITECCSAKANAITKRDISGRAENVDSLRQEIDALRQEMQTIMELCKG